MFNFKIIEKFLRFPYKFEKTSSRSLELAYIQATETSDKVMCKPNLELAKKHSLDYAKTDEFVKLFLNV